MNSSNFFGQQNQDEKQKDEDQFEKRKADVLKFLGELNAEADKEQARLKDAWKGRLEQDISNIFKSNRIWDSNYTAVAKCIDLFKAVLKSVFLNENDFKDRVAFIKSILKNHPDFKKLKGCFLNQRTSVENYFEGTPLSVIVYTIGEPSIQIALIEAFVEAGADPNLKDKHGKTPLMYANEIVPYQEVKDCLTRLANKPTANVAAAPAPAGRRSAL